MTIEIDVYEALESAVKDISSRRYNRLDNTEIATLAYGIIDAGARTYSDVSEVICLLLDKYPDSKERVYQYIEEGEA